jgi:hypothetical protein
MHIQDVYERAGSEDAQPGDVWLVAAPGFLWGDIPKGAGGYNIMEEGRIFERIVPI